MSVYKYSTGFVDNSSVSSHPTTAGYFNLQLKPKRSFFQFFNMPIIAIALVLYFAKDISNLNERIGTSFPNQPSWVFQIEGGNAVTLESLSQQYPNLIKVADKNTGEPELVDVREGHVGEYQVVTPFVVSLINLGFTPDPQNPPMNTANYKEGQTLTWKLTKSA